MLNRTFLKVILVYAMTTLFVYCDAQTHVIINNPATWSATELRAYGSDIIFDVPMYVCSYSGNSITISPRRNYAPTNQEYPRTTAYNDFLQINSSGNMTLTGATGYSSPLRTGMTIQNLRATKTGNTSLEYVSGKWVGNSRTDLQNLDIHKAIGVTDENKDSVIVVCGFNVENYDTKATSHDRQKEKVCSALAKINADIYGLAELRPGEEAIKEITNELNSRLDGGPNKKKYYTFIGDGTSYSSTGQKVGFIYDSKKVTLVGRVQDNNAIVSDRKKMVGFRDLRSDEVFIFSMNHFKAKVGTGTGDNADKGDGQGQFNADRVTEARSVVSAYSLERSMIEDPDILIMGDLNANGKEDPITYFCRSRMTDLHRHFHADSSYSYSFRGEAGYLDHALCSQSLLPQVLGMMPFHINSDESGNSDYTMFRSSDHDPVIVALKLNSQAIQPSLGIQNVFNSSARSIGDEIRIINAKLTDQPAFYKLYDVNGNLYTEGEILTNDYNITIPTTPGIYCLWVLHHNEGEGSVSRQKIIVY